MRGAIRVAGLLAIPMVVAGGLQAQVPKARLTLTGGPQAGTYEMTGSPICRIYRLTVKRGGERLSATFVGETADGVRTEGSVECR